MTSVQLLQPIEVEHAGALTIYRFTAELPLLWAYFPTPQSRHASEAYDPEYLPSLQSWHAHLDVAATVEEDVSAAHSTQTLLPAFSPYFPF